MERLSSHRAQDGLTLIELLVAMTLSLILLGATLATFASLVRGDKVNGQRTDAAQQARAALDQQAKQLRNLAKYEEDDPVIHRVGPDDFIFQTSDPTRTLVRYCLDITNPAKERLIRQSDADETTPTPEMLDPKCPAPEGWSSTLGVADAVVNTLNGADRPVFRYRCIDGTDGCVTSPSPGSYDQVINVGAHLYVNVTPTKLDEEIDVTSSVYLRNQNQEPVAAMSILPHLSFPRTVVLNGSGSTDFEGRTLLHYWFLNDVPDTIDCGNDKATEAGLLDKLWGGDLMGRGVTYTFQWPGTTPASGTPQRIALVVCDPGDRHAIAGPETVNIP